MQGAAGERGWIPRWGRSPWGKHQKPTPVFLSGESHGQRSLVDYSPQCRKEPHMTEATARTQMFGSKITLELESKAKAERISVGWAESFLGVFCSRMPQAQKGFWQMLELGCQRRSGQISRVEVVCMKVITEVLSVLREWREERKSQGWNCI